jgi:hypothetical protein
MIVPALAVSLTACGLLDDGDGGMGGTGGMEVGLEGVCKATLLEESGLMDRVGAEAWSLGTATAPAGQEVLLAGVSVNWRAYAFVDGEVVGKVATAPLEEGVHFTSDCADLLQTSDGDKTVLMDATFYEFDDLTGEPCTVFAGTTLHGAYSFMAYDQGRGQVSSEDLPDLCGYLTGFTADLVTDDLVTVP